MVLEVTVLHIACVLVPPNEKLLEILLVRGADVDAENVLEMTPFQVACKDRSFGNARLLLKYGSNIDRTNRNGDTSLHDGVRCNNKHAVEFLCINNANVNSVNVAGDTPLTIAAGRGDAFMVRTLIAHGADVNYIHPGAARNSVLLLAVTSGVEEVVGRLIEHHADVLYQNRNLENALFLACRLNRAAVVRILCTEMVGVDMDMRQNTADGLTALMARVLLDFGCCDLWMKSTTEHNSVTAYQLAEQSGHTAVAELIDTYVNPPTTRLY